MYLCIASKSRLTLAVANRFAQQVLSYCMRRHFEGQLLIPPLVSSSVY